MARCSVSGWGSVLLAMSLCIALPGQGIVRSVIKVSQTSGGFGGSLQDFGNFGLGLAAIGDLDGDGIEDLIVGERGRDDGGPNRGAVWSVFLNPDGSVCAGPSGASSDCWELISDTHGGLTGALHDGDQWGASVEPLGDLNCDGCPDVAVGEEFDDDAGTNAGAFWLLFLDASGNSAGTPGHLPAPVSAIKITQGAAGFTGALSPDDRFGAAIANLGDLDGNGTIDLAVGAPLDDDGGPNRGAVWILFLEPVPSTSGCSDVVQVMGWTKISDTSGGFTGGLADGDTFGGALTALGDLNGDGVVDLAVGANGDGATDAGAVWILFLNANGTVASQEKIRQGTGGFAGPLPDGSIFGSSLAVLPDRDCDGVVELAVGSNDGVAPTNTGAVWILLLDPAGTVHGHHKISATSGDMIGLLVPGNNFGASALEFLGDRDGDGHPELAVGDPLDDDGGTNRGAYYVLEIGFIGPYPGSGLDLTLATGVGGQAASVCPTVKTVPPGGGFLTATLVSPGCTYDLFAYALVGQLFPTAGPAPSFPGIPILHVSLPGAFVIDPAPTVFQQVLPPGGKSYAFALPPAGLGGQSLMLQGLVFPVALPPFIVTTDGHEIRF